MKDKVVVSRMLTHYTYLVFAIHNLQRIYFIPILFPTFYFI